MKYETDRDVLQRHAPNWNASVHLEKVPDLRDVYFKIRTGLRDESFVDTQAKVIYAGTETRNDYTGWNVSTELPWHLDYNKSEREVTLKAMSKTAIANEAMLKEKEYKPPIEKTKDLI